MNFQSPLGLLLIGIGICIFLYFMPLTVRSYKRYRTLKGVMDGFPKNVKNHRYLTSWHEHGNVATLLPKEGKVAYAYDQLDLVSFDDLVPAFIHDDKVGLYRVGHGHRCPTTSNNDEITLWEDMKCVSLELMRVVELIDVKIAIESRKNAKRARSAIRERNVTTHIGAFNGVGEEWHRRRELQLAEAERHEKETPRCAQPVRCVGEAEVAIEVSDEVVSQHESFLEECEQKENVLNVGFIQSIRWMLKNSIATVTGMTALDMSIFRSNGEISFDLRDIVPLTEADLKRLKESLDEVISLISDFRKEENIDIEVRFSYTFKHPTLTQVFFIGGKEYHCDNIVVPGPLVPESTLEEHKFVVSDEVDQEIATGLLLFGKLTDTQREIFFGRLLLIVEGFEKAPDQLKINALVDALKNFKVALRANSTYYTHQKPEFFQLLTTYVKSYIRRLEAIKV